MEKDARYVVVEPIRLKNGNEINSGTEIRRTHGTYYMDGFLLPEPYQLDFDRLINNEEQYGWYHLKKMVEKIAFRNSREEI